MEERRRRSRARRPTILLSLILAGGLLAVPLDERAYPDAVDASNLDSTVLADFAPIHIGADHVTVLGARSAFSRRWAADDPDQSRGAVAAPIVFFASADTVEDLDAPFDALVARPSNWGMDVPDNSLPTAARSDSEISCLATAVYFEARGEGRLGQLAVAQVVMNRVKNPAFPKTICGVVYQNEDELHRCQFSFACDGVADRITDVTSWRDAVRLAREVVTDGSDMFLADVGNSTHYHAIYASPLWAGKMKMMDIIGHHIFYEAYGRGSS